MRIDKIPDDAVLIKGTIDEYVDPRGNVYGYNYRHGQLVYPYRKEQQEVCGYWYVPINYINGKKTKRAHRVVAEAFIPNPHNLPIVMHKDNNKKNNCVDNLKWGTISENTKQAYIDGLAKNDSDWDDSQSIPCKMFRTSNNELVEFFGSYSDAERCTGISTSTIKWQIEHPEAPIKKTFYFTSLEENARDHVIVVQYDFKTDKEINRFSNCGEAAKITKIPQNTISAQVLKKAKPKWAKNNCYFKRMFLKGVEIIEI